MGSALYMVGPLSTQYTDLVSTKSTCPPNYPFQLLTFFLNFRPNITRVDLFLTFRKIVSKSIKSRFYLKIKPNNEEFKVAEKVGLTYPT